MLFYIERKGLSENWLTTDAAINLCYSKYFYPVQVYTSQGQGHGASQFNSAPLRLTNVDKGNRNSSEQFQQPLFVTVLQWTISLSAQYLSVIS